MYILSCIHILFKINMSLIQTSPTMGGGGAPNSVGISDLVDTSLLLPEGHRATL
jgi:hypothetical protein